MLLKPAMQFTIPAQPGVPSQPHTLDCPIVPPGNIGGSSGSGGNSGGPGPAPPSTPPRLVCVTCSDGRGSVQVCVPAGFGFPSCNG